MTAQDCKLPIGEGYKCLAESNEKLPPKKNNNKILLVIAALLLITSMTIILGFTFQLAAEMKELRDDIENLKNSIKKLESNPDQYDDLYTPEFKKTENENKSTAKADDDDDNDETNYNDFYEYISDNLSADYGNHDDDDYYGDDEEEDDEDDQDDDYSSSEMSPHLTGERFTKDAKTRNQRAKRNVVGYTDDGVPINSESFAEARRRNATSRRNQHRQATPPPSYSSLYPYPYPPGARTQEAPYRGTTTVKPPVSKKSRVLLQEDKSKAFRQIVKKSSLLKSLDQQRIPEEDSEIEFTVVRSERPHRHRPQHLEMLDDRHPRIGRMRPLPTAHFSGDTSKYTYGQHENYNGNGHLKHPHSTYIDWVESSWYHDLGMDRHFSYSDGILTIKDTGLYFVYAQIYYLDEHDTNGYRVYKNNEPILQCTTMTHSGDRILKGNTCYTAAAEYLQENDKISLGDLASSRYSLFEPGKSFFGVIKLGDVKIK